MVFNVDESSADSSCDESNHFHGSVAPSSCGSDDESEESSTDPPSNNDIVENEYDEMKKYAAAENKMVNRWRWIVIASILITGAVVASITYITLNGAQESDSDDAFILFANTINDSFQFRVKAIFEANRALSRDITTSAKEHGETFPYYSVQSFEVKAFEAREHAGFETVIYAPIVINEEKWINFTQETRGWLDESKLIYDTLQPGLNRSLEAKTPELPETVWAISEKDGQLMKRDGRGNFLPTFQTSPPPIKSNEIYENVDLFSDPNYKSVALAAVKLKDAVFSQFSSSYITDVDRIVGESQHHKLHNDYHPIVETDRFTHPHSIAAQPIYNKLETSSSKIVGYLFSIIAWDFFLVNLLPQGVDGVFVVFRNSCNQSVSYQLDGNEAVFVGEGDLHDSGFNSQRRTIDFASNYYDPALTGVVDGHCQIFLDIYPSSTFNEQYDSALPIIFTIIVALLFVFMALMFAMYDRFVQHRNQKVVGVAARSNAIVSSLFPTAVRDRLMQEQEHDAKTRNLKGFLSDKSDYNSKSKELLFQTKPIADLFPETTVIFADIVNFTAWSSVRDPSQVFTLLEAVYNAFDDIARKRRVFKVETIGDCYVAVCGLPEPAKDHAVTMARFARDCMRKMWALTNSLEASLGPDTGDLTMRMGLHSGPVTAGVLRGERSRFQLFGDTMNTAARMESTGFPDRIQVSQDTADLIIAAGKQHWITSREDMVNAKGKGLMQTYFLEIRKNNSGSSVGQSDSIVDSTEYTDQLLDVTQTNTASDEFSPMTLTSKNARLVEWVSEVLMGFIKEMAMRRVSNKRSKGKVNEDLFMTTEGHTVLDEVTEIILLPGMAESEVYNPIIDIDPEIGVQLRHYLTRIAAMYQDNPFHNFEHASHVTMSVQKLLARIIAPSDLDRAYEINASAGADHTYGITSDPLTQFSCVFSAVIHDVDHPGVPNVALVNEKTNLAVKYKNKSIAEQNSVDLAWKLLMHDRYKKLRSAIYTNDAEMCRFRQLVVNSVMATDIADKDQKTFRNARWDKAFHQNLQEDQQVAIYRKATIVIEHLIQASDVSHTMQHWHIYRKWNQRFFEECYRAFKLGRSDTDPSLNWYQGEIGFFDFYIIPLAKKLKECGVFGVSSDEYLNYAVQNRHEWKARGEEIVSEMIEKICREYETKANHCMNEQTSESNGNRKAKKRLSM